MRTCAHACTIAVPSIQNEFLSAVNSPRSQVAFGNALLFFAKFHFALMCPVVYRTGIGNEIASASAFPNGVWERGDVASVGRIFDQSESAKHLKLVRFERYTKSGRTDLAEAASRSRPFAG